MKQHSWKIENMVWQCVADNAAKGVTAAQVKKETGLSLDRVIETLNELHSQSVIFYRNGLWFL